MIGGKLLASGRAWVCRKLVVGNPQRLEPCLASSVVVGRSRLSWTVSTRAPEVVGLVEPVRQAPQVFVLGLECGPVWSFEVGSDPSVVQKQLDASGKVLGCASKTILASKYACRSALLST